MLHNFNLGSVVCLLDRQSVSQSVCEGYWRLPFTCLNPLTRLHGRCDMVILHYTMSALRFCTIADRFSMIYVYNVFLRQNGEGYFPVHTIAWNGSPKLIPIALRSSVLRRRVEELVDLHYPSNPFLLFLSLYLVRAVLPFCPLPFSSRDFHGLAQL